MIRGTAGVGVLLRDTAARLAAAGLATARQDAELLLGRVLARRRLALYLEPDAPVPDHALELLEALVGRRTRHEPLQYLLGEAEFCGLQLAVGPGVFIPRPETELLVARALARCPPGAGRVIEVCAGSAAIACALATRRPALAVTAVELAPPALTWAHANVRRLGLTRQVTLVEGDLFHPLAGSRAACGVDLVVANPPYLAQPMLATLPGEVRDWEPRVALDGGPDGTEVLGRILAGAPEFLRPGGYLVAEIAEDQGAALRARLGADRRYDGVQVSRDWRGDERVLEARRTEWPSGS